MGWVVRLSVNIGWALGAGVQQLLLSIFSRSPGPKGLTKVQKREQDETRRIAGCREVVLGAIPPSYPAGDTDIISLPNYLPKQLVRRQG